jgi:hypothetical protein
MSLELWWRFWVIQSVDLPAAIRQRISARRCTIPPGIAAVAIDEAGIGNSTDDKEWPIVFESTL